MGHLTDDITRLVGEIKAGHAERASFIKDMLCQEVATMREGFRRTNEERAREVKSLRQEVAADLEGARRAWFGPSPAERRAQVEAERRAREQAERERRAQEEAERQRAAEVEEANRTKPEPKGPATKKGQAKIGKGSAKK